MTELKKCPYVAKSSARDAAQRLRTLGIQVLPASTCPRYSWQSFVKEYNDAHSCVMSDADFEAINWLNKHSIFGICGPHSVRVLEFAWHRDQPFNPQILDLLRLPADYQWLISSGNGYHIWFKCEGVPFNVSRLNYYHADYAKGATFSRFELRWESRLALPPYYHPQHGKLYRWVNDHPTESPAWVEPVDLLALIERYCEARSHPGTHPIPEQLILNRCKLTGKIKHGAVYKAPINRKKE